MEQVKKSCIRANSFVSEYSKYFFYYKEQFFLRSDPPPPFAEASAKNTFLRAPLMLNEYFVCFPLVIIKTFPFSVFNIKSGSCAFKILLY